jgi:D-proline reductase (dithiol) PrdB
MFAENSLVHKAKGKPMPIDLEKFKPAYEKWVAESLPFYQKGDMKEIVKKYPFVVPEGVPWTPYTGRPSEQKIALVTTGGLYLKDKQPPFNTESIHGDSSFREIPRAVRPEELAIAHAHFDHSLAEQDINVILPIQRFIELEEDGMIGKLADTHYSFSYVNDVVPLVTETAPEVIRRFQAEGIDVLFLVPV